MAGEEAAQVILQVSSKAALMTTEIIYSIIKQLCKTMKNHKSKTPMEKAMKARGKQSIKNLTGKNMALDHIPVSSVDIKAVKNILKNYGVDFSVMKNKNTKDFNLFFKGTDTVVIADALANALANKDRDLEKSDKTSEQSLSDKAEKATQKAKEHNEKVAQEKSQELNKNKNKERDK